jgi:2'-hydroxyisoflavone reductase
MERRTFVSLSLGAGAAALLPRELRALGRRAAPPRSILVLGGTSFLGPALVEAAVVSGHRVTLFNRGVTNPGLFPSLEKLRGLRGARDVENLSALRGRTWDAIVDVWPSDPALAESAARQLAGQTAHYLYVSSIAAYDPREFAKPGLSEDGLLNPWNPEIRPYNRGKAESERRLHAIVGDKLTIVRPGPIKGARDDSPDLLTWIRRMQAGGPHIGPGRGDDHVQNVDVKDVARFLVLAVERHALGTFNLTGAPMTFRDFLDRCRAAARSDAVVTWIPREFLHAHGLDPAPFDSPTAPSYLGKFPYWHPEPERRGFYQISSRRAFELGWRQRPFAETVNDYLWALDSMGPALQWTDELAPDVEARVLSDWAQRRRS